jgi:putative PIN family toxin of toxin-antitoxin system
MKPIVVIDTNVIISAGLSEKGNPAKIVSLVLDKKINLFYSEKIMAEYVEVLSRPHFNFNSEKQNYLLNGIQVVGTTETPTKSDIPLPDESDRIFYDLAKEVGAYLITGNKKHYPDEDFILTPAEFLQKIAND